MVDKSNIKRSALGKGLGSLLGPDMDEIVGKDSLEDLEPKELVEEIPLEMIQPNPAQPRKSFSQEKLLELSQSILAEGVIQPILLIKNLKGEGYEIIAGERRWRASKLARLEKIPAIIKDVSRETLMKMAIIENIQREDLNVIEEALAYQSLIQEYGLSQEECAEKVGKDRSSVSNLIRLLALPKEIQEHLVEGTLSMGHGRALLSLEASSKMIKAAKLVLERKLSVRETEKLIQNLKNLSSHGVHGAVKTDLAAQSDFDYMADILRKHLKTKVKIAGSGSRGRIEISYFSASELERIMEYFKN